MASSTAYSFNILNDGAGNYSLTAFRNPSTAASGGTSITSPWMENTDNGTNTTTKLLGVAIQTASRAVLNDLSTNG